MITSFTSTFGGKDDKSSLRSFVSTDTHRHVLLGRPTGRHWKAAGTRTGEGGLGGRSLSSTQDQNGSWRHFHRKIKKIWNKWTRRSLTEQMWTQRISVRERVEPGVPGIVISRLHEEIALDDQPTVMPFPHSPSRENVKCSFSLPFRCAT